MVASSRPGPLALSAALVAALAAAGPAPALAQDFGVAARVNGAEISSERLARYFDEFLGDRGRNLAAIRSPTAFKELKREALDELVDQELLWQEARRRKHVASEAEVNEAVRRFEAQFPDERRRRLALDKAGFTDEGYRAWVRQQLSISRYVEREVTRSVKVRRAEARAFYDANPDRFSRPAEARVRLILARVDPAAGDEPRAAARARLEPILAEARRGADFAALARRHSDDGSAPSGGDLGWSGRGQLAPAIEEAAFSLPRGGVSAVLETPEGLAVVKVEDRHEAGLVPFPEVEASIKERLLEERRREAVRARVEALRAAATIEILIPL